MLGAMEGGAMGDEEVGMNGMPQEQQRLHSEELISGEFEELGARCMV